MKTSCCLMLTMLLLTIAPGCGYSRPAAGITSTITTLAPASENAGDVAFTLTVNGSGFSSTSVVYWNASPRTTTFVSGSQVTAQITAADIATAATDTVYVRTSGGVYGGGTNSNTITFVVN